MSAETFWRGERGSNGKKGRRIKKFESRRITSQEAYFLQSCVMCIDRRCAHVFSCFNKLRFVSELICSPLGVHLTFCIFFKQFHCA